MNPKDSFEVFYNKSLRFLSFRPRSEKEVREYLIKRLRHSGKRSASRIHLKRLDSRVAEAPQNDDIERIIGQVIENLKEKKFINDEEFARWWIEQRREFKPRSEKLIKMELRQKGISEEIITAIQSLEFRVQNDLEQAKRLAQKRIQRYKGLGKKELYEKLGRFLASKGFDWGTVKQSIDEVLNKGV